MDTDSACTKVRRENNEYGVATLEWRHAAYRLREATVPWIFSPACMDEAKDHS
jgi:hypothetical protein